MSKLEAAIAAHVRVKEVTEALELLKDQVSEALGELYKESGKGPYQVEGSDMVIAVRGDLYFMIPAKKGPRKPKVKVVEAPEETE
jgi:Ni,Fe-hydrogenase III large subunit